MSCASQSPPESRQWYQQPDFVCPQRHLILMQSVGVESDYFVSEQNSIEIVDEGEAWMAGQLLAMKNQSKDRRWKWRTKHEQLLC